MTGRVAWRLASAAIIRPNVEALVTATQQIQVVSNLLIQFAAEADVHGVVDVGIRLSVGARGIGSAAVRLCKLLGIPRDG